MTDHETLMVALRAADVDQDEVVTAGDVVRMLYELGACYRASVRARLVATAAS